MKKTTLGLVCLGAFLTSALVLASPDPAPVQGTVREFNLRGDGFSFSPGRIEVQKDDIVKITFTAVDIPHSFSMDGPYPVRQARQRRPDGDLRVPRHRQRTLLLQPDAGRTLQGHARRTGRQVGAVREPPLDAIASQTHHTHHGAPLRTAPDICSTQPGSALPLADACGTATPPTLKASLGQVLRAEPAHRADESSLLPVTQGETVCSSLADRA